MFGFDTLSKKTVMPTAETAIPGRDEAVVVPEHHFVNGRSLKGPYPDGFETIYLGMGCFWGAERLFWKTPGVYVTAVGYSGGMTRNPHYQETTTGLTGHAEVVKVVYDPSQVTLAQLLKIFFEEHDPTQGMRQGNDVGTTYRSVIYTTNDAQLAEAKAARDSFQQALETAGHRPKITTEIEPLDIFYYAEDYHQQYLAKNPGGYCGLRGTGVTCNIA
ncbi:peptide-methionine (S)-S-oxide reductase MsrA [Agrobacterium sp. CNPSo 3708]|uniref:peptide-methionine (S)-S-oxide reductase MsrA n=1 Tax=unclassified Agrobacterium TaxID=2632611 RepID=UPI0023647BE1|nr:peptide-methionine (S)-S-oxide reductase MsrA [Agrobacterium sp. CNPSo 3708]MDD1497258.1 peptide-methionine (S)-S-oxide reductase MsrA [Agrobacterium sp. CNPSo 3708]